MPVLFKARTDQGYIIKVLSDLLQNNIKMGCFVVDKSGIYFRMSDTHQRKCIDISLIGENFITYEVNTQKKIFIGVNLIHLYKMLKPIKKKDSIEFIKESEESDVLDIKQISSGSGKVTTSSLTIQNIQNLEIELPSDYTTYVPIPSSEYQKMCKDMENISQTVQIKATEKSITFKADMTHVYARSIVFGDDPDAPEIYNQIFDTEELNNLKRISGLGITSGNIHIFCQKNRPILLRTNIGTLGKINIYIKSKEQIENEKTASLESDE
jgi:proliferating cell nuclear antigen PCNA